MANNTLELVNQSAHCLAYKNKSYTNNHHLFIPWNKIEKMPGKKSRKRAAVENLTTFKGAISSNGVVIPNCM